MVNLEDYKGFKVRLTPEGMFYAHQVDEKNFVREDTSVHAETLTELKKKIDKKVNTRIRQPAIFKSYSYNSLGDFKDVTITSVDGRNVWVSWKVGDNNRREKTHLSNILRPTDENRQLIETYKNLGESIRSQRQQQDDISKKFDKMTLKDLGLGDKE